MDRRTNTLQTDGQTDRPTDQRTQPVLEVLCRTQKGTGGGIVEETRMAERRVEERKIEEERRQRRAIEKE